MRISDVGLTSYTDRNIAILGWAECKVWEQGKSVESDIVIVSGGRSVLRRILLVRLWIKIDSAL